jgi:hypothetical protein
MAERLQQQKLFPYDGEQNSTKHPLLIDPTDIVDSDNIVFTTYSTKKLRPGLSPIWDDKISGNNPILGIKDFHRLDVGQKIVWYDGERVWAAGRNGIKDDITGDVNIPHNEAISFEKISGLLFIFFQDGRTQPKYWTGTGTMQDLSQVVADIELVPKSKFGRVWLNSLWLMDPDVPGRLLKSATGDPTDYSGGDAQAFDLDVNDGDPDGITAIFPPLLDNFYVTKRLSIYKLAPSFLADGTLVFAVTKIISGVGCNSHNSVTGVESDIFFTSDRGFHSLIQTMKLGGVETTYLSLNIQSLWKNGVNFKRSRFIWGVYDREINSYIINFPPTGSNYATDAWSYNIAVDKLYRWRHYNQTALAEYIDFRTGELRTAVGSFTGDVGFIDQSKHTDYGKRYPLIIQSGIVAPTGSPDDRYRFQFLAPIFVPQVAGTFTITYFIDGRPIETQSFSMTSEELGDPLGVDFRLALSRLGGLPQFKLEKRTINGYGMTYQLLIQFDPQDTEDPAVDFELLGILMDVDQMSTKTVGTTVG